ncbi:hypothetical protein NOCA2210158 [metagenome]|uniref:Uncharacterized protein n=1 Tax=metagenome TaxID=256318 RepID=A0A2P2BYH5_9ZZZZ
MVDWEKRDPMADTAPLTGLPPAASPQAGLPAARPPVTRPLSSAAPVSPVLVQIGEIQVSADTVYTPTGSFPLAGTQFHVHDQWSLTQKIPTWAIVCAVVGFCVVTFFSLLFLLAKEDVVAGSVAVTVTNGAHTYTAYVPVGARYHAHDVHNRVNYARGLLTR